MYSTHTTSLFLRLVFFGTSQRPGSLDPEFAAFRPASRLHAGPGHGNNMEQRVGGTQGKKRGKIIGNSWENSGKSGKIIQKT